MTGLSFALRGLWHFRKSYAGVLAGSALGAMVLLGALMAGDSVKETLRQVAAARLGKVDAVLASGGRFFRSALADDMAGDDYTSAPVLMLRASATVQRTGRGIGGVRVLGVDDRFWKFSPGVMAIAAPQERDFYINEHLQRSLGLGTDETLILRFDKPALIAADAPLAGKSSELISLSGNVARTCGDREFGRFSLENTQLPQATVFVPIHRLQEVIGMAGKANLMLLRDPKGRDAAGVSASIRRHCKLEDYGISVADVPLANAAEIRTSRIFFDREVAGAIRKLYPDAQPVITYMANTISANGKETPYSMVTAVDAKAAPFLSGYSNGVVLNSWIAEDLGASMGDEVKMDYYVLEEGNRLVEKGVVCRVAGVVDLTGLAADRTWMPDFPGVAEAKNAADWDAGVPIDLKRIRDKDEKYWDEYRGVPKMFLPLEKGREWFGNRWGEFTALRVPGVSRGEISNGVLKALDPNVTGLVLQDIREQGMAAAESPVDFAGLFIGMSIFLMAAAVALTAMLFRFHIEVRNRESGLLAALGISSRKILRWRMLEGLCVVMAGSVFGALLAMWYTRLLLAFLETIWSDSGGGIFRFHVAAGTLITGITGFVLLMMGVIWWVTRGQARHSASLRLEAGAEEIAVKALSPLPWLAGILSVFGLGTLGMRGVLGNAGAFFLGGFLFLLAGLAAYHRVLRRGIMNHGGLLTPRTLAVLNCGRRGARSLVVAGCLASGVFMVISVAAFRKHAGDEWRDRNSGAGGFAFWVETTTAVKSDARDPAGLGDARGNFSHVLPFRIGAGDDASCFNLNQISRPRMLAGDVGVLSKLGAFTIKSVAEGCRKDWLTLREGPVMRAFVDESTLMWVLKRKLGDRVVYQDERGAEFSVEIAGILDDTVFQGSFVVDESRFLEHYPSSEGARLFLIKSGAVGSREVLQMVLADRGVVVQTTRERLAAFHGVENTYIVIFHLLGGLGVVIGSAGLGVVTARNMLERRSEFAVLHRLGVPVEIVRRVVVMEAAQSVRWGLGIGLGAAMVSIFPAFSAHGSWRSIGWLGLLVLLIAVNAGFWSWLGFRGQLRKSQASCHGCSGID
jgi:putative ABC transport system permease protein